MASHKCGYTHINPLSTLYRPTITFSASSSPHRGIGKTLSSAIWIFIFSTKWNKHREKRCRLKSMTTSVIGIYLEHSKTERERQRKNMRKNDENKKMGDTQLKIKTFAWTEKQQPHKVEWMEWRVNVENTLSGHFLLLRCHYVSQRCAAAFQPISQRQYQWKPCADDPFFRIFKNLLLTKF